MSNNNKSSDNKTNQPEKQSTPPPVPQPDRNLRPERVFVGDSADEITKKDK
ncbi:hypothetical protein IFU25_00505 [Pantoea agglomerans]|uniref:hypothetical protein n=1 Tax=Enterobacter agglomerans TaxID=549 RepID=UPI001781290C|nr:hypothetical protein [Pantoea agglomerans]MBD8180173.1 hypothetical protein [Pantoea agglomerans]